MNEHFNEKPVFIVYPNSANGSRPQFADFNKQQ